MTLAGGQPYSLRPAEGRRRARPARAAGAARRERSAIRSSSASGRFEIRGVIESEPGRRLGAFSLGPRVFVTLDGLREDRPADLRQPRVASAPGQGARRDARRAGRRRCAATSRTSSRASAPTRPTEDDIGENFARAENYLSLVGLVIVILGGIGVSSVTRVFVQQKIRSIAVLKCVGARSSQLLVDLPGAGGRARPGRQRARRRARGAGDRRDSGHAGRRGDAGRDHPLRRDAAGGRCRGSASACSCRCCSRWCRCSTCAT